MPPKPKLKERSFPTMSASAAVKTIFEKCGNVRIKERYGSSGQKVIFLPEAMRELECIVSHGRASPMNAKEQKFIGLGHFFVDEEKSTSVIVSHIIQLHTMNRTRTSASNLGPNGEANSGIEFLSYYVDEYINGEAKYDKDAEGALADPFIDSLGPSEYVLEGHTHPDLGAFFSMTDRITGSARAASLPIVTFCIDPIRKQMVANIGKDFTTGSAEVICFVKSETVQNHISDNRSKLECFLDLFKDEGYCIKKKRKKIVIKGKKA